MRAICEVSELAKVRRIRDEKLCECCCPQQQAAAK